MTDNQWRIVKMFMNVVVMYFIIQVVAVEADTKMPNIFRSFNAILEAFQEAASNDR